MYSLGQFLIHFRWPFAWASSVDKVRDNFARDYDYFKKVHENDQKEIKRLLLLCEQLKQQSVDRLRLSQDNDRKVSELMAEREDLLDKIQAGGDMVNLNKKELSKIDKSLHLAAITAGDNWKAKDLKYMQVKEHYRDFKRQVASVVRKIFETPQPETIAQGQGFHSAMQYAAAELENMGAYDPSLTLDDIESIYGGLSNVPDFLLTRSMIKEKKKLLAEQAEQ